MSNDQKNLDNAAKKVARRYEKVQKREANKAKAVVEEIAVTTPATIDGMVKLAGNTKLEIELMENLSSALSTMGETVWFRVAGDVAVDGNLLIPSGTRVKAAIRQVSGGRSYGAQGILDVVLVSVDLDDRTRIPLVGQLAKAGEGRTAGVMTGMLVGAFIKGTEAFHAAGTKFSAWTREDVWLQPVTAPAASPHPGVRAAAHDFPFGANTRRDPAPVELSFPCAMELSGAQLVSVGGWQLAGPVKAIGVKRSAETCTARFSGWSVLRHMHASTEAMTLHLHGLGGDTEIHVDIPARIRLH